MNDKVIEGSLLAEVAKYGGLSYSQVQAMLDSGLDPANEEQRTSFLRQNQPTAKPETASEGAARLRQQKLGATQAISGGKSAEPGPKDLTPGQQTTKRKRPPKFGGW